MCCGSAGQKLKMCAGGLAKTPLRRGERDIVDTIFHASRATRQISAEGSALPTLWEGQTKGKGTGATGTITVGLLGLLGDLFGSLCGIWATMSPCYCLPRGIIKCTSDPLEVHKWPVHPAAMAG